MARAGSRGCLGHDGLVRHVLGPLLQVNVALVLTNQCNGHGSHPPDSGKVLLAYTNSEFYGFPGIMMPRATVWQVAVRLF